MLETLFQFGLSESVALAVVAAVGYLFGRSQKRAPAPQREVPAEMLEATEIAREIEQIADVLRHDLAYHRAKVERFKSELQTECASQDHHAVRLRTEAERMLTPTLQLVGQLSTAYDQLRKQSAALATFSGCRQDPLTGIPNARALEERLAVEMERGSARAGGLTLALVQVGVDEHPTAGGPEAALRRSVTMLQARLRPGEFLAKLGPEELALVLPSTRLSAAQEFLTGLLGELLDQGHPAWCGVAEALPGDRPKRLLSRADAALYTARRGEGTPLYRHTGFAIEPVLPPGETSPAVSDAGAVGGIPEFVLSTKAR